MEELWRQAWEEQPRLLAIARRRSRNRADAEEIVAEAVVKAVTHPGVRPAEMSSLLTAIVMRLCVDRLRDRAIAERHAPRLFARPTDATEEVLDRAEAAWVMAEFARLADRERAALAARMLGLTVAETAEMLGVTYKSAESALDRAKRKMRSVWARTLALLPLRRRPRLVATVVVAAAVTATLTTWQPWRHDPVVRLPAVPRAQEAPTTSAARSARRQPGLTAAGPGAVRPSRPPSPGPLRVATPDLSLGPVRQEPVEVAVDLRDPVRRVQECLRNGVGVETSSRVGVTCRENRGTEPPSP